MPNAVPVLPVSDLGAAVAWYERVGFSVRTRYEANGYAILGYQGTELHLNVAHGMPGATETWSGCYLRVTDVDEVHARWMAAGAREVGGLVDQPWGIREFATEDLDGNLWRVGSPVVAAEPETSPADGSAGTTDQWWHGIVSSGTCAGCGLRAGEPPVGQLAGLIRDAAHRFGTVLADADDDAVRTRPAPEVWSALEYGAHVRDTLGVFTERIVRTRQEDEPELGWWDHEAAIAEGFTNELEAALVVDDLGEHAARLAAVLDSLPADAWERAGTRAAPNASRSS
ncbi:MAG: DinB family protein [Acidimicrobiales bacterium]